MHEHGVPRAFIQRIGLESEALVSTHSVCITSEYLQCDLAGPQLFRMTLYTGKRLLTHTATAHAGDDRQVMNIDQRLAGKG